MGLGDQVFQRGKIEYFDKTNRRIDEKSVSGKYVSSFDFKISFAKNIYDSFY